MWNLADVFGPIQGEPFKMHLLIDKSANLQICSLPKVIPAKVS
jgi:hypothetical protein